MHCPAQSDKGSTGSYLAGAKLAVKFASHQHPPAIAFSSKCNLPAAEILIHTVERLTATRRKHAALECMMSRRKSGGLQRGPCNYAV